MIKSQISAKYKSINFKVSAVLIVVLFATCFLGFGSFINTPSGRRLPWQHNGSTRDQHINLRLQHSFLTPFARIRGSRFPGRAPYLFATGE